ncbi:hypothetical protein CPB83DRAFT_910754 [Crepidotus variabilis]|uniref:Ecp2 effector protein domain-containing protein n=1 Tax=Crepidotus variabilis TaxID=179855 RepID=A0A9P6JJI6_9AGAR|nr:hypothetical protein CPB83DRAFT_910754 [Crepidotus variabilis]
MLAFNFLLASVALFITGVHASPTVYPEFIPGPGLPSLKSLNLTSKNLYDMKPQWISTPPSELEARSFNNECLQPTANVDDTISCFNYLVSIGNSECTVPANLNENAYFVAMGEAMIVGLNQHETAGATSSSCRDVALAVQWLFINCNQGGRVGGRAVANGNGDLVVEVQRSPYY